MENILFCFEPFCYLAFSNEVMLVYNELESAFYKYSIKFDLKKRVIQDRYFLFIKDELSNVKVIDFIRYYVNNNCAKIIYFDDGNFPYIQRRELFNEQNYLIKNNQIPKYSNDIIKSIYFIGSSGMDSINNDIHRQIPFPLYSKNDTFTNTNIMDNVLSKIPYSKKTLFFIVSNDIEEILYLCNKLENNNNIIIRMEYTSYILYGKYLPKKCKIELMLFYPYEFEKDMECKYIALIRDKMEYNFFIKKLNGTGIRCLPIYNSSIYENPLLSLNEDDILQEKQSIRKILFKKLYNTSLFGLIYITASGDVYDSLNSNSMGEIDTLQNDEIVSRLLSVDSAWMLTRKKVKPCMDCLYCDFCSPVSEYERSMNMFSICQGELYEKN